VGLCAHVQRQPRPDRHIIAQAMDSVTGGKVVATLARRTRTAKLSPPLQPHSQWAIVMVP